MSRAKLKENLIQASKEGDVEKVKTLLRADIILRGIEDKTMYGLHYAAENNHTATVQALLRAGANCSLFESN